MAVAIICFGSLINFHQYKIWGKPLIPEFVGYKPDHQKTQKQYTIGKDVLGGSSQDHMPVILTGIMPPSAFYSLPIALKPAFNHVDAVSPLILHLASRGLRAPPLS
jgi:hypothetical protein